MVRRDKEKLGRRPGEEELTLEDWEALEAFFLLGMPTVG